MWSFSWRQLLPKIQPATPVSSTIGRIIAARIDAEPAHRSSQTYHAANGYSDRPAELSAHPGGHDGREHSAAIAARVHDGRGRPAAFSAQLDGAGPERSFAGAHHAQREAEP